MPDPLLPPDPPQPAPDPPQPTRHERPARIECGFCACTLVAFSGDVLKMSELAKQYRDQADAIEQLTVQVTAITAERDERTRERDDARQPRTPVARGIFGV